MRVNQIVNDTVQNILINKGTLDISDVAWESFVSTRQLERLFQEYIGVSPKRLSNLIRYHFLWNDILYEAHFDVLNAVYKYGYTDQSHLLREFKRYHSMDIYSAKAIALKNVGNIQEDISVCGTDCSSCYCFGKMCNGCNSCEGKLFHAPEEKACPIYDCVNNNKCMKSCGECNEVPCKIWLDTREPKFSDEEFNENVAMRINALRNK
ncbi:MAG: helix-turn-helix domain-containing protein [Lachnospiraceae bacterium]